MTLEGKFNEIEGARKVTIGFIGNGDDPIPIWKRWLEECETLITIVEPG
jgi:hypothetical protein